MNQIPTTMVGFLVTFFGSKIEMLYLQKFPTEKFRIEKWLKTFTNKYGKDIYGEDAYENMLHRESIYLKELMSSFLNFKPAR